MGLGWWLGSGASGQVVRVRGERSASPAAGGASERPLSSRARQRHLVRVRVRVRVGVRIRVRIRVRARVRAGVRVKITNGLA